MADSFVEDPVADTPVPGTDVEMTEGGDATPAASQPAEVATATDPATGDNLPFAEGAPEDAPPPPRVSFMQYLTSPVVTLLVGSGDNETILTAHQSLLTQSPFFAEACAEFANDGSPRQIELTNDDAEAVGCFLEFLYTGEYFPRKLANSRELESDPSLPKVDDTGDQLLKHARVYTLAEKFGLEKLKNLAASKIHRVSSTAKGEIAYARYVYQYTPKETRRSGRRLRTSGPCEATRCVRRRRRSSRACAWSFRSLVTMCLHAYWTRSSSARRTRRCIPLRAAHGRGQGTARSRLEHWWCGRDGDEMRAVDAR